MISFGKYTKTISALITGIIGWLVVVVESASDSITSGEWIMLAVVVATALGVYALPNTNNPPPTP